MQPVVLDGGCVVEVVGEPGLGSGRGRAAPATPHAGSSRREAIAALVRGGARRGRHDGVVVLLEGRPIGRLSPADATAYTPAIRRFAQRRQVIACRAVLLHRGVPGASAGAPAVFLHLPSPGDALNDADPD
jgi:hypothetical protein